MTNLEHLELETPFGRLRGAQSGILASFHRVPYAEAPIGPRRFEMPSAPPHWRGVRDATAPGPIPPQNPSRLDAAMGAFQAEQSEDCLHLDIWTCHKEGDHAPVLVFIHGGAFTSGGGSLPCYDGSILAKENGLIVVNISYRLGILGFWPQSNFGGLNLGLHDQIAALRWINEAISCFGGDPQRITVIGQSAGAFSIAAHIGGEFSAGLFKRAIMMSAPVGLALRTTDQAKPIATALLKTLGLGADEVDKLRTMPLSEIFERLPAVQKHLPAVQGDITPVFMPVLDGSLVPLEPVATIQMGAASWCDVMIGVTSEEYSAFAISNPSLDQLSDGELKDLFRIALGDNAETAISRIRSERVPATPRAILGDLHTDGVFVKSSLEIAAAQSRHNRKAFTYFFDWESNPALGACHCIDLPFLFGNIDAWKVAPMLKGANWREVNELSRLFRGAITAFAASGDPNGTDLPRWPAYGSERAILHFDRRIRASAYII